MALEIQVLTYFILAQVWLSMSQFVFELEVDLASVTDNVHCDIFGECDIYFSVFCLREGRAPDSQSTNEEDCSLGRNTTRMNAYGNHQNELNTRRIMSQKSWPVRV